MEGLIEEAEDVIRYIDDWEPSDEEDELDEEELWEPVIRHMTGYPVLALDVSFGVKDKEKKAGWSGSDPDRKGYFKAGVAGRQ